MYLISVVAKIHSRIILQESPCKKKNITWQKKKKARADWSEKCYNSGSCRCVHTGTERAWSEAETFIVHFFSLEPIVTQWRHMEELMKKLTLFTNKTIYSGRTRKRNNFHALCLAPALHCQTRDCGLRELRVFVPGRNKKYRKVFYVSHFNTKLHSWIIQESPSTKIIPGKKINQQTTGLEEEALRFYVLTCLVMFTLYSQAHPILHEQNSSAFNPAT